MAGDANMGVTSNRAMARFCRLSLRNKGNLDIMNILFGVMIQIILSLVADIDTFFSAFESFS